MHYKTFSRIIFCPTLLIMLLAAAAAGQTRLGEEAAARLQTQADECGRAFIEGDFERLADYTHPKVLEKVGGRAGMIAFLQKSVGEMKAEGFNIISYVNAAPTQVLTVGRQTYAILPATLKARVPQGVLASETFMLAVSADGGRNWKFVSGSVADSAKLKLLFPAAAGRLKLPAQRPPVLEPAP